MVKGMNLVPCVIEAILQYCATDEYDIDNIIKQIEPKEIKSQTIRRFLMEIEDDVETSCDIVYKVIEGLAELLVQKNEEGC